MQIPFDGIMTLLIFLVGIPALVLQLISTAERRAVIKKEGLDVQSFLRNALRVIGAGLILQFSIALFMDQTVSSAENVVEQIVWLFIFIFLFYFVIQISKRIPEQYGRRDRIIEKLVHDILTSIRERGRISGVSFNDLANLGKHCDPGQEREMVVKAFTQLVQEMLGSPKYKGGSFEALLDELVHMLVSNPEPKDLGNYDLAVKTLSAILSANGHLETDDDKRWAVHAMSKLGRTLIIHFNSVERDNIILDYIDSLEFALVKKTMLTEVSQALFEIGICAVEEKQDFMVVAALDKMTSLAEDNPPLPNEFVADLLGLLAHFWAEDGSRREFAETKLCEVEKFLPEGRMASLEKAQTHCKLTMYFDVADELGCMLEKEKARRKPRRKKETTG